MKKFLLAGFLACSLLGGGILAYKNYQSSGVEVATALSQNKAELIRNLMALHDDDFHHDKVNLGHQHNDDFVHKEESRHLKDNEKLPGIDGAYKKHFAGQVTPSESSEEAQVIKRTVAAEPGGSAPSQNERDQAQAQASETESLRLAMEAEHKHQAEQARVHAEQDRMKAEQSMANGLQVANEVEVKQQAAAESLRRHSDSQKQSLQNPDLNPDQAKLGLFTGVLAKCYIAGHDVHWIDSVGNLLHVKHHEPLSGNALAAREIINANSSTVVLIYEKGYEVYDLTGNLLETGNRE